MSVRMEIKLLNEIINLRQIPFGRCEAASSHSAKQLGKGFALGPDKEGGEHDDEHERWAEQAGALGYEDVKGEEFYETKRKPSKAPAIVGAYFMSAR
jgi:hypothetical protein